MNHASNIHLIDSHSIWHEILWFKAHNNQHQKIYNIMSIKSKIMKVDFRTSCRTVLELAGFEPLQWSKSLLRCLCEWLDKELRSGCARIFKNWNPPLLSSSFKYEQNCTNCYGSCFNLAQELSRSMNQPKAMQIVQEFERKFWEKKKEWKISRSEKWSVVSRKTVMLRVIFSLLIMFLITLKQNANGLVKWRCKCKLANAPLCMKMNGTVHENALEFTWNVVWKPMQVLECENNALILNYNFPSKI